MERSQQSAHRELERRLAQDSDADMRCWLSKAILTKYMELFASLFFCKDMITYISIKIEKFRLYPNGPKGSPLGVTNPDPSKGSACVEISLSTRSDLNGQTNRVVRRAEILHTLLHEMTHAIFVIYGCYGSRCQAITTRWAAGGFSGHGPSWVAVFRALIERMDRDPILAFVNSKGQTRSGLLRSIKYEKKATRENQRLPHPDLLKIENEERTKFTGGAQQGSD